MEEAYWSFKEEDGVTLKRAWEMYKDGAKDWALDKDFPFYKLMNSTNFRKAIGINGSLKEGA